MYRADIFVSGRYWLFEVCFLAMLFSTLFTGGIDEIIYDTRVKYDLAYFMKIEHPLADVGRDFDPTKHDAKLNFRLTVPIILHWLPVPYREWWFRPALTACAIYGLLALCCILAYQVTGDRICGLWVTLGVASTYIGTLYTTRYYDAIALCQLLGAMLPRMHWSLRGLLVFTAAFTDERAFVAAPLLLFTDITDTREKFLNRLKRPSCFAVFGGMAAYCGVRVLLEFLGLSSPMGGVGIQTIALNARYWHSTAWFALEGGWLLVVLSMLSLWRESRRLEVVMFACAIVVPLLVSLMVLDILRSAAYALPAVLVALTVLGRSESTARLRTWCLSVFIISFVAGDFGVFPNPWHTPPLVVKWLSGALQAIAPGNGTLP
jgi:hypothetical protein